jgi:sugar lactone lactonase YvrE
MYISDDEKTNPQRKSVVSNSPEADLLSQSTIIQVSRRFLRTYESPVPESPVPESPVPEPPVPEPPVPESPVPEPPVPDIPLIEPATPDAFFSDIFLGYDSAPIQPYFDLPQSISVDSNNNVFFADRGKNFIRRIDAVTAVVSTVVGTGTSNFFGDFTGDGGSARDARLKYPYGVAVDASGNLLITENFGTRVRRVAAGTEVITTVSGNGTFGFSGDGGAATSATLNYPSAVAIDASGNVLIADTNNNRIRRVDVVTGFITTVAGNGTNGFSGNGGGATGAALNYPSGVAVDASGNIFIADTDNNRIRRVSVTGTITSYAGTGSGSFRGDGGVAINAILAQPRGVTLDSNGNLFFADTGNHVIRRVAAGTGIITTVAGMGELSGFSGDGGGATGARLNGPHGVAVDASGNLFISDTNNNRIRRVDAVTGIISTLAGNGYILNSSTTNIKLSAVTGVTVVGNKIYVADSGIHNIYVINRNSSLLETVYGNGVAGLVQTAGSLQFRQPYRIAVDSDGNIYVADNLNSRIRRINFPAGDAITIAGGGSDTDTSSGIATSKSLNRPAGVAVYGSIVYFSNTIANKVCKIENGDISNVAGVYLSPQALAVDSAGNLYVANSGRNRITKVTGNTALDINLPAGMTLNSPKGVAIDTQGSIYVVDGSNSLLIINTTGTAVVLETGLNNPMDVSIDVDKNVYVATLGNNRIMKLSPISVNSLENSVLYIPTVADERPASNIITFPVDITSADYVTRTSTSITYAIPEPFNVESYSVNTVDTVSLIAVDTVNISINQSGGIVYIRINNLTSLTSYRTTLTCVDVNGGIVSRVLADTSTTTHAQTLNRLSNMLYTGTTPILSSSPPTLVTTVGYNDALISPSKTNFLYNYYDYDVITYPLIRLYGKWSSRTSGNLTVTVNGYSDGTSWAFYNNEFKIYAKLFSSGRAVYGQTNGLNTIVISDGTTQKTVRIYYARPAIEDSTPKVRAYLFDGYNGPGTCDAPPSRTDNTLNDNENRMKLDLLLIQSFFAETFKGAREAQEGTYGLPYTTFVVDLDSNDEPIVDFITDLSRTRGDYIANNYNTSNGLLTFLAESVTARYGASSIVNGGNLYSIGYAMVSHIDPATGVYTSGISDASTGIGIINSANLIWHPKSLSEMEAAWNDQSPLPTIYNQFDNAYNVGNSCARIIGALLHELTHTITSNDHPSDIITLTNLYPSSYLFPFDAQNYRNTFGIDYDDATFFRNWVMGYNYNRTTISHVYSELGPSSRGWWSPYVIHGYVNVNQAVQTNYTVNTSRLLSTAGSGTITLASATTDLIDNDPIVICFTPTGAMPNFSGLTTGQVLYIHSVISPTQVRFKKEIADTSFLTSLPTISGNVSIIKYNDRLHLSANRSGWINSNVLLPHPKKTNLSTFRTNATLSIPNDFREGYLDVYAWGSGGKNPLLNAMPGGAGGFVKTLIPIKNTDTISLKIGVVGGGGVSNPRSGGPYGGAGGGSTIVFINNLPYVIAGGGGGAGYTYPGRTVYQTTTYSIADGPDGVNLSGSGGDNLQYGENNFAGCGGAGHRGGLCAKNINGISSGGGYGTSYVRSSPGLAVIKGSIPSVIKNEIYQLALSSKHIIPSVFDAMPTAVGSSQQNGCVALKFIYTKSTGYSNLTIPAYTIPPTITTDSPSVTTLIPRPLTYSLTASTCTFNPVSVTIYYVGDDLLAHAEVLQSEFFNLTAILPNIVNSSPVPSDSSPPIFIVKNASLVDSDNQYHKFNVTIQSNLITVEGYDIIGVSHGTSTLLQLLRVNGPIVTIATSVINDYSTCRITGIMIDMARDSYEIHNMKYLIDMCRFYKMRYIHIHGNDEGSNNNPVVDGVRSNSPEYWDSGMVFYWNPVGNVVSGDPTTLGANDTVWYRIKSNWDMLVEYARIRGVAFIPEIEMYGRGNGMRGRFPLTFGSGFPIMNLVSDACHNAIKSIIQQLSETFYTSPFIFFGCDESDDSGVANISGAEAFCNSKNISYNRTTIINYYFYQMYFKINSIGKEMIVWNDYSTLDRNTNFLGTNGVSYSTNNSIISCVWMINGGAVGADGYVPGGGEDTTPYNLHSGSSTLMNANIPVLQTPWKPRIYSRMKAMFDWSVGGGLNTTILNPISRAIEAANPLPITPLLMGSETLLWESANYHDVKALMLRYRAPMRAENTYSFGKNTTSWYSSFSPAFDYLDNRFTTIITGLRLLESGITQSLSYRMQTDTDTVQIPYTSFGDGLRLSFVKNNSDLTIYYTLTSNLAIYPYTDQDTRVVDLSKATLYTSPIEITKYDTRLLNGFICFRAQCYDSSNNPVGPVIDRRYVCELFKLNMSGALLPTNNEGRYGNSTTTFNASFNSLLTLTVSDISTSGYVNFSIRNRQIPLSDDIQINIYSTTDPISISYFDSNGISCGKSYTIVPVLLSNPRGEVTGYYTFPFNIFKMIPIVTLNLTFWYQTSTNVQLRSLLSSTQNYPGGVILTCIVVGRGGSGASKSAIGSVGGGGGGGGGIAREVYYNVPVDYSLSIEIGTQSSLSFTPVALSNLTDALRFNKLQDPIYPTIAYAGTNGVLNVRGRRGAITKGDVMAATDATDGAFGMYGAGGRGYVYNGYEYGKGGNGGVTGASGTQGFVLVNIRNI